MKLTSTYCALQLLIIVKLWPTLVVGTGAKPGPTGDNGEEWPEKPWWFMVAAGGRITESTAPPFAAGWTYKQKKNSIIWCCWTVKIVRIYCKKVEIKYLNISLRKTQSSILWLWSRSGLRRYTFNFTNDQTLSVKKCQSYRWRIISRFQENWEYNNIFFI